MLTIGIWSFFSTDSSGTYQHGDFLVSNCCCTPPRAFRSSNGGKCLCMLNANSTVCSFVLFLKTVVLVLNLVLKTAQ